MINEVRAKEYYSYLMSCVRNIPEKKFIIFAQGRTGSTLLVDLLDSHKEIQSHDEILNTTNEQGRTLPYVYPYRYVKGVASRCNKKVYGYKTKIYQIRGHKVDPKEFMQKHIEEGWKVIYLRRKNIFRQALSGAKASKTDIWHQKDTDEEVKVKISPKKVFERMVFRKRTLMEEKKLLEDVEYKEVVYERDLMGNIKQQKICNDIFDFLGVKKCEVETEMEKINKLKVTNKKEIMDEVKNLVEKEIKIHIK